jgi:hypothetical protein
MTGAQQNPPQNNVLKRSLANPTDPNSTWGHGWYLFEDGKVVGPLAADDAFSKGSRTRVGNQRMVSRKGFAQWYPLQDFAELHLLAGKYAHQVQTEQALQTNPQDFNTPMDSNAQATPAKNRFLQVEPKATHIGPKPPVAKATNFFTRNIDSQANWDTPSASTSENAPITQQTSTQQNPSHTESNRHLSRKEKKRQKYEEKRAQKEAQTQTANPQASAAADLSQQAISFEAQYLLVASRLRLGKTRSTFWGPFFLAPITLMGYWAAWVARASEEVTWHVTSSGKSYMPLPIWMCLIPGVHLLFAHKLAAMVAVMEQQNGYKTVSPMFATFLAVIPPFYMQYIQDAMNRHWRLHVRNTMRPA